ncbi:MAG: hypothetical protein R6T83_07555 [Salinibacter sp.]
MPLPSALAQPADAPDPETQVWVHGGPAVTTLGPGLSGGVAVAYNRHVMSLRGVSTDLSPGRETWEAAGLYGRAITMGSVVLSAGTGVSVVGGTGYPRLFGGGPGASFDPMIGFPIEGHLAWTPTGVLSLGLYAFANVNTAQPLGGLGLTLRLGDLR